MTTTHVKSMLDSELSNIETSQKFQSMLMYNAGLQRQDHAEKQQVLLIYHAFSSACDSSILENPLTIGGYVHRAIQSPDDIAQLVAEARNTWGSK